MKVFWDFMQDTDIPILEAPPLLQAYAQLRGVRLRPECVTLHNALLLKPERPVNVIEQLRTYIVCQHDMSIQY